MMECHLCGYRQPSFGEGRWFDVGCACLREHCDGEAGDECAEVFLCSECV